MVLLIKDVLIKNFSNTYVQTIFIFLKKNEYGNLMFNVCVELPIVNDHIRKTTIALKNHPDTEIIEVVTAA